MFNKPRSAGVHGETAGPSFMNLPVPSKRKSQPPIFCTYTMTRMLGSSRNRSKKDSLTMFHLAEIADCVPVVVFVRQSSRGKINELDSINVGIY